MKAGFIGSRDTRNRKPPVCSLEILTMDGWRRAWNSSGFAISVRQ